MIPAAADPAAFISANTRLLRPPLVPEIHLHLAEESLPIWQLSEDELGEKGIPSPFWAFAWAGGQALARYSLDHPETVRAKSVVDLGTGSGLVAIAAAQAGAARVLANDVDPFAIAAAKLNAAANDVALDLSSEDMLGSGMLPGADVLLLGDLFYDAALAERACEAARRAARSGTQVFAGDPVRAYFPADAFSRIAEYEVPVTRELEDAEIRRTSV